MIARYYTVPGQLVSGNEYNPQVWPDEDYDYAAYRPAEGSFWDRRFVADLEVESNTSFAHMPLYGRRLRQQWRFMGDARSVLLGNRGPQDGVDNPLSYTYGRDQRWRGHVVFGDGHIEFAESFTPSGLFRGAGAPDNLFAMEEGVDGADAILAFTKKISGDGPVLQHD